MKVILVNPPISREERRNPVVSRLFSNAMPLGIAYLASVLISRGIATDLLDAAAEGITQQDVLQRIRRGKYDLLGITSTSVSFHRAIEIAGMTKTALGESFPVILGGAHVSAVPREAMEEKVFDVGVLGEAEETFCELAETLAAKGDLSRVRGICYREGDWLRFTQPRPLIQDLDSIPFPARHLLKKDLYSSLPTDVRRMPKFSILANRGCPFQCIFCDSAVVGKRYRSPSPRYLVDEMEMLKKDFGAREIFFVGTTFTVSRERTEAFIDELERRRLDLLWTCSTRVDVVDRPLLERMKKAGCWAIRFGVESGSQEVLDFIKKGITKEQVQDAVEACRDVGIHTKAFFMVGHLIDTPDTIRESIEFAKSLPLTDLTVQINTPLPNTEQFREAARYGCLDCRDYSRFSFFDPVFVPRGMTAGQLTDLHRQFYREFFWRPGTLWQQLKKMTNLGTFINYVKCADLIFHLTVRKA